MEEKINFIEPLFERVEEYGKTSYELVKLQALEKTSEVLSTFISRIIAAFIFYLFIILLNFGLALWLGDIIGKSYYGFLIVAGFYGLVGLILYFFAHPFMKKRFKNSIISQMFN
jgi:hypothetical protein